MATPVGVGRALCTALCPGSTGIRTAPPVPPVRPQTEASALIVPAAADPVRRRGAGARPDGVFSGAPWHRPARPPGVIAPHNGTVERQRKVMSVSVNAVDDPSHGRTSMRCPPSVRSSTSLGCTAMRHRQAQGSGAPCARPQQRAERPRRRDAAAPLDALGMEIGFTPPSLRGLDPVEAIRSLCKGAQSSSGGRGHLRPSGPGRRGA